MSIKAAAIAGTSMSGLPPTLPEGMHASKSVMPPGLEGGVLSHVKLGEALKLGNGEGFKPGEGGMAVINRHGGGAAAICGGEGRIGPASLLHGKPALMNNDVVDRHPMVRGGESQLFRHRESASADSPLLAARGLATDESSAADKPKSLAEMLIKMKAEGTLK